MNRHACPDYRPCAFAHAAPVVTPPRAAAKIVCSGCGQPGRAGDPLLHATRGYAHNGCDRP